MPPKKAVKSESLSEVIINEPVTKGKAKKEDLEIVKKPRKTKKAAESEVIDESEVIEDKKTKTRRTKKETELEDKNIKINNEDNTSNINSTEYNLLKAEWAELCEKIKNINKEKDSLELQKNQILNKLWKLGETSYPKTDIFETNDKPKITHKISSIQTKILDNDSSDSSNSDSSDDSESEKNFSKSKKNKKISKSDSDTSDSDSD